jgi:hypothetical protein
LPKQKLREEEVADAVVVRVVVVAHVAVRLPVANRIGL